MSSPPPRTLALDGLETPPIDKLNRKISLTGTMASAGRRPTISSPPTANNVNNVNNNNNNNYNNSAALNDGVPAALLQPPHSTSPSLKSVSRNSSLSGRPASATFQASVPASVGPGFPGQARSSPPRGGGGALSTQPPPSKSPAGGVGSGSSTSGSGNGNGNGNGKPASNGAAPRVYGSITQGTPRFGPHATANGVTTTPSSRASPNSGAARTSQLNVDFEAALQQVQSAGTPTGACKNGCGCNTPPPGQPLQQQSSGSAAQRSPTTPSSRSNVAAPLPSPSTQSSSQGQRSPNLPSPNGGSSNSNSALPLSKRLLLRHKTSEGEQMADAALSPTPTPTPKLEPGTGAAVQTSPPRAESSRPQVKFQVPEARDSALRATLGRPSGASPMAPVSGASAVSAALGDLSDIFGMPFRDRVFTDTELMRKRPVFARPGLRTCTCSTNLN